MDSQELKLWRSAERKRLLAARLALDAAALERLREAIDTRLEREFPWLAARIVAFCWSIQNEYDARHLARRLRERGARTALPVVVAPRAPLSFRLWKPGDPLAEGALGIAYPAAGDAVVPEVAIVPVNGFDSQNYRLGYGGGYFDRTLAALAALGKRPVAIGVGYEIARIETIHPQDYDVPMDWIVTESGAYQPRNSR
jgi:5,10-methenyltetrahydrofolate synthetase